MKRWIALALIPTMALGGDTDSRLFEWLEGCWSTPDKRSQEVWVIDSEQSLAGFAVSLSNNAVGFYEVLTIKQNESGSWVYVAHPSGQASTAFVATEIGESSVLFVNPDHDYPQEIRYRREGKQLLASISLLGGNNSRSFDKLACE